MKLSTEFKYGILIFLGIGIYFLLMEALGLSDFIYLRILNVFIIIFGLNLTIKSNLKEGKHGYLTKSNFYSNNRFYRNCDWYFRTSFLS